MALAVLMCSGRGVTWRSASARALRLPRELRLKLGGPVRLASLSAEMGRLSLPRTFLAAPLPTFLLLLFALQHWPLRSLLFPHSSSSFNRSLAWSGGAQEAVGALQMPVSGRMLRAAGTAKIRGQEGCGASQY